MENAMSTIDITNEVRHLQKRLAMSRTANVVLVALLVTAAAGLWLQTGLAKTADQGQPQAAAQISIYGLHRQADMKAMPELPFHDRSFVFTSP
jgi:hypothetical protein